MSKSVAYGVLSAAVLAVIVVGALVYFRQGTPEQTVGIPPVPANAAAYGQWYLIGCQQGGGDGTCRLVRRVVNNEAQRVVLSFAVVRVASGNALIVVGLPPSVVIPAGVTITPEGGTAAKGNVVRCAPQLCTAAVVLNDALIDGMSAAQTMSLQFVAANGRNVNANVPIAGFREGIAAWLSASPPPAEEPASDAASPSDQEVPDAEPPG